ncbi:MAG: nicotinate-nucleotide adenylyltransferase [Pirellulales bacterium]|nr:nicotinate-nucleotide adenylyltransferase [Pirellulales bacterium]
MRLGLFGGSFDPVHFGHLMLAESAREQCRLDRVLFLPAAVPPHKLGQRQTPIDPRIEMLRLATGGHEAFEVSRLEADRGGVSYTVDTLRHFREADPGAGLFFLMGADMLHDLPNWREAGEICRLAIPVVVRRPGISELDFDMLATVTTPDRIEIFRSHQVEMPEIGISSTEIRRRVAAGGSIRYWTPRAVEKYIETQGLYRVANLVL